MRWFTLVAWCLLPCAGVAAEDQVTFTMRTNRLHEIIVSLCDPHPPVFAGCTSTTDGARAQEIADRLVTLVSGGHYHTLQQTGATMTLTPEHPGGD